MLDEFGLDDLQTLGAFILENSRRATLEKLAALPPGRYRNRMVLDGYDAAVTMAVELSIAADGIVADFAGTSPVSRYGINVPLIYTKAYACYGLKCALAPEIPNNAASLAPFDVVAPPGCILNALRPAPVSVRHVLGHFVPDLVLGALHELPARAAFPPKARAPCGTSTSAPGRSLRRCRRAAGRDPDVQQRRQRCARRRWTGSAPPPFRAACAPCRSRRPSRSARSWCGARSCDRIQEAPAGSGAVSGRSSRSARREGHEIRFNAMFDRIVHPADGRDGGRPGQAGMVASTTARRCAARARRKRFRQAANYAELPGGGGFGDPAQRDPALLAADLRNGYISPRNRPARLRSRAGRPPGRAAVGFLESAARSRRGRARGFAAPGSRS